MAVLTDKQMDKHIKERNFAKVYLIYGEEQMYVKKYTDKLVTAVAGKTPSEFNFHSFGDSINFDELAASVQIVPFMSEFNCVLVSDAAFDEFNANVNEDSIIIDAIFGSGLNRKIEDKTAKIIGKINHLKSCKIAIDVPSGIIIDENLPDEIGRAHV
mgnify:CR=1 FL=1